MNPNHGLLSWPNRNRQPRILVLILAGSRVEPSDLSVGARNAVPEMPKARWLVCRRVEVPATGARQLVTRGWSPNVYRIPSKSPNHQFIAVVFPTALI